MLKEMFHSIVSTQCVSARRKKDSASLKILRREKGNAGERITLEHQKEKGRWSKTNEERNNFFLMGRVEKLKERRGDKPQSSREHQKGVSVLKEKDAEGIDEMLGGPDWGCCWSAISKTKREG